MGTYTTVAAFGLEQTAALLTKAFADYLVPIPFTTETLRQARQLDDVDFEASPVAQTGAEPVGAALVSRRGDECRVAGMGLVPAARGRGAGRELLERILAEARERGDRCVRLEVIAQNTAALRLYETAGFRRKRRLLGFAGPTPLGVTPEPGLTKVSVGEVSSAATRCAAVDWPWQISAATLARLPAPAVGYGLDGAWTVVVNPATTTGSFRTLVVEGESDREARAARLLRAVMARHSGATAWRMSALLPEELGGGFTRAGLPTTEMSQWQMERTPT